MVSQHIYLFSKTISIPEKTYTNRSFGLKYVSLILKQSHFLISPH